jgi:3-deoxy-7-phosphoheptulonate synthase
MKHSTPALENIHVAAQDILPAPAVIHAEIPASQRALDTVLRARGELADILQGRDRRVFAVVGPCSIHHPGEAVEYAQRLARLARELSDRILVVMRVYFEKPRTTTGWKGLVNDPRMDDSFHIEEGLRIARRLLVEINDMELPCGTEALDPISPQYLGDLIAWAAIGARTTESQTHREMASGLSPPVGFKNGTDGGLEVALNAMLSARQPHAFLGVNGTGQVAVIRTTGNPLGHLILRGGTHPNYDSVAVSEACDALRRAALPEVVVIDCSHGNSRKNAELQPLVLKDVVHQMAAGNSALKGVMLESNLCAGNQKLVDPHALQYGISVTDACIDWGTTERALRDAYQVLGA